MAMILMVSKIYSHILALTSFGLFVKFLVYGHSRNEPDPYSNLYVENMLVKPDPAVSLQTNPFEIKKSGDAIKVLWSGISTPSEDDFLAFYSPPETLTTPRISESVPITFQYAHTASSHMNQGKGELEFNVLSLRDDYVVGFFKGGLEQPVLVGVSNVLVAADKNEVTGVHLAMGKDSQTMMVSWVTKDSVDPTVFFQEAEEGISAFKGQSKLEQASAIRATFTREDLCGAPANSVGFHDPGSLHTAALTNLKPGTTYSYVVGDKVLDTWSDVGTFQTPPADNFEGSIRFALFADLGTARPDGSHHGLKEEFDAIKSMSLVKEKLAQSGPSPLFSSALASAEKLQHGLDFVLHVGDISYADGYLARWDEFLKLIEPVASRIPWMTAVGNHERCSFGTSKLTPTSGFWEAKSSGGECNVPYRKYFPMPYSIPEIKDDSPWYSFDYGPVHFTVISSEHDFTHGSKQFRWIVSDFQKVDRSNTPWLLFASHRPMYVSSLAHGDGTSDEDQDVAELLQQNLEPLLLKYQVDVAVYGHHHSYQRSCQIVNGKCVSSSSRAKAQAPVHVVVGMAGRSLSDNPYPTPPEWNEKLNNVEHGVTFIEANQTHFYLEFLTVNAEGSQEKRDEFLLWK